MPGRQKHPLQRRFVVYALTVHDIPFYIGIGRSENNDCRSLRAEDRVRFVRYMMDRDAKGKTSKWLKWSMSTLVVAEFIRRNLEPEVRYLHCGLTQKQALVAERNEITSLVLGDAVLANRHHNSNYPSGPELVVKSVLKKRNKSLKPTTL